MNNLIQHSDDGVIRFPEGMDAFTEAEQLAIQYILLSKILSRTRFEVERVVVALQMTGTTEMAADLTQKEKVCGDIILSLETCFGKMAEISGITKERYDALVSFVYTHETKF